MNEADAYAEHVERVEAIVAGVSDAQWGDPTPCSEWDVRTLTEHIVGGLFMFGTLARGETLSPPPPGADLLGPDPAATYRMAASGAVDGFRREDVLDRIFPLPAGNVPGSVALRLALMDIVVHGWDLATATGQDPAIPDDLAEAVDAFCRQMVSEGMRRPHAPDGPFAQKVLLPEGAGPVDRLVAFLGRRPMAMAQ